MTLLEHQEIKEPDFNSIPEALKNHAKWMLWKAEPQPTKKNPDKVGKVPYHVDGFRASKNNPEHYLTFDQVKRAYETGKFDGIGVVINSSDNLVCIDLDDFEDINKIPLEKFSYTMVSYTEVSPSGNGLHIWVKGRKPEWVGTKKNGIEFFGSKADSFITVTGDIFNELPVMANQDFIMTIAKKYFSEDMPNENPQRKGKVVNFKTVPDDVVLNKMFSSKHGEKIKALFLGETINDFESQSEADMSLCNHLAYWTNNNREQMDRLFKKSGLYREKWDEKRDNTTYGFITIDEAISKNSIPFSDEKERPYQEEQESTEDNKPNWWIENSNGTVSLRHVVLAEYIIEKYNIVHYPDIHGELYFYNVETGIYELDKKGRSIRSFIREEHEFKQNQVKETIEYIYDMSPTVKELSKNYIAVNNGLLHLETMEFKDFTPDEFLISKIPTNYNPNAFDPFVDDTLKRVTDGYEPSIRNLEEMLGCVLYPKVLVPKMWYLYGATAHNGKSTIVYMIHKTFNFYGGNISAVTPQKIAKNNFASASMYGKMANVVDDLEDTIIHDIGALKTIITGGFIEIEKKNQDSETVEMTSTLITASNHYPEFREHGNQINRRLHIIPFEHSFDKDKDRITTKETYERLASETAREYVLKLSVDAIKRLLESTEEELITPNEKSDNAKKDFAENSDPLTDYFHEYPREYFLAITGTEIYNNYVNWCYNESIQPLSRPKFIQAVKLKYNLKYDVKRFPNHSTVKRGFKED